MAKKNEAKVKFSAETKDFNDSIKKSNKEMSLAREELKLADAQMKTSGKSVEGLQKKHDILQGELSSSQDKTEALSKKLEKAITIFGENSEEAMNLRVQLVKAQSAQEKIKQEINACNKELEEQVSNMNEAEDVSKGYTSATSKLSSEIEEQQSELSQLKKRFSDLVLEQKGSTKEAKELKEQIDKLSKELKENESKLKAASKEADNLDNSLEDVSDSSKEATDGFTVMKDAMGDLVADGIEKVAEGLKEIGTNAFNMAIDIDQATNSFIAKTGASVEEAEKFKESITDIYNANLGENFEDIADSMAIVEANLKLTGDALKNTTQYALIFRDTFGIDVEESVRAASQLMTQFGLTAEEAYNLMSQGAQNGLNKNGDLMDVINEYSVHFEQLGFDAEEMFNILKAGVDSGAFSVDKVGDAFKEFGIRVKEESDTMSEAFESLGLNSTELTKAFAKGGDDAAKAYLQVNEALAALEDPVKQNAVGVALYGTMWEDLGGTVVGAMADYGDAFNSTKDTMESINDIKYDDLGSALEGIGRNLETSLAEPMANEVMPVINEFIQETDWDSVGGDIGSAFSSVATFAVGLASGIRDVVTWMKEYKVLIIAIATVIGVLVTAITLYNTVQGVMTAIQTAKVALNLAESASLWAVVSAQMAVIAPYLLIVAAVAAVIAIIVVCVKHWDQIKEAITNFAQVAIEGIKSFVDGVVSFFGKVIDFVKNNWQGLLLMIVNPFAGAFKLAYDNCESFRNGVNSFVANVKSVISSGFTAAKNFIVKPFNSAKETVLGIFENIKNGISTKLNAAKSAISTIIGKIKGLFNFDWSLPKLKIPKISVDGGKAPWGIGGKGKLPSFNVTWHKDGGIFKAPTLLPSLNGFHGVGEAGAEAILPISLLQGYVSNAVERSMGMFNMQSLISAIDRLANRPVSISVNGKQFAMATAGDNDGVQGLRSNFINRGLILE